jgi:quercetin dioxygenase-like cupin family protein
VLALTAVQTDEEAPPMLLARVRHRLMARIAQDATPRHLTVSTDAGDWHKFLPGIERKVLQQGEGLMSYLLRLAPGAVLPAHRHPVDEECIVISGVLRIGADLKLAAGDFHMGRKGIPHAAITSDGGAVIYLRGAEPAAELLI